MDINGKMVVTGVATGLRLAAVSALHAAGARVVAADVSGRPRAVGGRSQRARRRDTSKSSYTLALGKRAFYRQLQMSVSDAYEYAGELVVRNMAHHDAKEGIAAFVEKRSPAGSGANRALAAPLMPCWLIQMEKETCQDPLLD